MSAVPVNYLAILVAAIASMVLGFLWYGPLFGKMWMKWQNFSHEHVERAKAKGMNKEYAIAFVAALVMAYVLQHAIVFAGTYLAMTGLSAGLMSGFFNWLGFVAPVTLGAVLWEGKSWKLWCLLNAYQLVSLLVMGAILAKWM